MCWDRRQLGEGPAVWSMPLASVCSWLPTAGRPPDAGVGTVVAVVMVGVVVVVVVAPY